MLTSTRPCDPGVVVRRPRRAATKGGRGSTATACGRAGAAGVLRTTTRCGSSDVGVPARAAQPVAAGPVAYQSSRASGASRSADPAAIRAPGQVEGSASRTITAATTAAVRASASTCIQPTRPSLPVPSAWTRAIGQAAYASQWNRRHVRKPKRPRRRLVMVSASSRSKATAPSPSQTGRYAEPKGTTASCRAIGAKPSSTVVAMCSARKTSATSVRLRCSPATRWRGHCRLPRRRTPATPRQTIAVSRISETTPVPRVAYHMAREPPRTASTAVRNRPRQPPVEPASLPAGGGRCRRRGRSLTSCRDEGRRGGSRVTGCALLLRRRHGHGRRGLRAAPGECLGRQTGEAHGQSDHAGERQCGRASQAPDGRVAIGDPALEITLPRLHASQLSSRA